MVHPRLSLWNTAISTSGLRRGGTYEYTVPFTGNFTIIVAGAQAASYDGDSGGKGNTLTSTIRLHYNDTIKFVLSDKPSRSKSGSNMTIPGGGAGKFYINGNLVLVAGGGGATVTKKTAPSDILKVYVYNGDGESAGGNNVYDVHWHNGDTNVSSTFSSPKKQYADPNAEGYTCYTGVHEHHYIEECHERHACGGSIVQTRVKEDPIEGSSGEHTDRYEIDYKCTSCGAGGTAVGIGSHPSTPTTCGNIRCYDHIASKAGKNKWTLHNVKHGQIMNVSDGATGANTIASGYTATSANNNTGAGTFTVELNEQQGLYYQNTQVKRDKFEYLNSKVYLLVTDNTVVYYRRP